MAEHHGVVTNCSMRISPIALLLCLVATASLPADEPSRVVSASGSLTEIVCALGEEDRLAAVDTTSVHPESITGALPKIGYSRALSAEGILALQPDLVLATDEAGPPTVLDQLRAAQVPLVVVEETHSPDGVRAKIVAVAEALGVPEKGRALAAEFDASFAAALAPLVTLPEESALFLFGAGGGSPQAAGSGTAGDAVLALAGLTNAMGGYENYKPVNPEALAGTNATWIITTPRTVEAAGGLEALLGMPGVSMTPAASAKQVIVVEDAMLLNFGPRLPEALRALADARLQAR